MSSLIDTMSLAYFQRAMAEAVLVGVLAGVVSVHVLLRRQPFFVVAMSHATFPGVVIASLLGLDLFVGGTAFGVLVAVAVVILGASKALDNASVIGIVLAGAFALGVVLLTATPAPDRDLTAFLVGSILTVTRGDLVTTVVVAAVIAAVLTGAHKHLVFGAFDPEGARAQGYRVALTDFLALLVVTVVVVTVIPAVGTLLAVSLLTVPALTARLWTQRIGAMMAVAGLVGALSGLLGLLLSALWEIAAGGAIACVAAALFVCSYALRSALRAGTVRRTPAA